MPTDSKIIGKSTEHISAGRNRMPNRCLHTDGSPDPVVTFLFTDVEGSSKHWQRSPDAMRLALARHDEIISASIAANSGHVFKTIGDAFCAAFESPTDALNAVIRIQTELFAQAWSGDVALRVRAALNSGQAESRDGDYYGHTVNVVSRLLGLGHGGQTLVSAGFHARTASQRLQYFVS